MGGHPRGNVIAYIWIGVVLAGFLAAMFFQDDDPNTDDAAGVGVLIFIVGSVLTGAYLVLASRLRTRGAADDAPAVEAPATDARGWLRRHWGPFAAGAAAIGALAVATPFAPEPVTSASDAEPVEAATAASTTTPTTHGDLRATIRAAARAASGRRPVESVDCMKPLETENLLLVSCAVTFEGPACQLWLAGGADDPDPLPIGDPAEGLRGRADRKMAHCE
jgi:hypothetical protein